MDSTQSPNESIRILIVEDDTLIRQLYSRVLRNEGYTVDEAEDGQEGLLAMHKGGYDLILLDIMLPIMDGLQILEKITTTDLPVTPNKRIMLLTNVDQKVAMTKGLNYAINGYLLKSKFSLDEIRASIKAVLDKPANQ